MIGIGELPIAPRPTPRQRRRVSYMSRRTRRGAGARSTRAPAGPADNTVDMIFDQPPADLPVATLRPRETGAQLLLDVRGWLLSKWRWLRPRSIPVAVAFAGMLGVLASANYLRELAHRPPEQLPVLAPVHGDGAVAQGHTCGARKRVRPALAATVVTRGAATAAAPEATIAATAEAVIAVTPEATADSRLAPAVRFHIEPAAAPAHAPAR